MRAAAIFGLGCSAKNLKPFQDKNNAPAQIDWRIGMPEPEDHMDVLLLFGGDGTIHRHLPHLVKLGLPVLIVPAGSGNDFARALGLHRVNDSLAAWRKFCSSAKNVRTIDLGTITPLPAQNDPTSDLPRYFCSIAGIGLDAEVARRANQLPRWLRGHGGYVMSLVPTIFRFAPLPIKISTPQDQPNTGSDPAKTWALRSHQPTLLAAFANSPSYGGGMKIAPRAQMDDGQLDVCIISALDPFKLFCLSPTVYFGRHLKIKEVKYFQSPRVRVETETPLDVYADGEFICRTPVEIGVERQALKVVTP